MKIKLALSPEWAIFNLSTQQRKKQMTTFTKTYNARPTEKQLNSISRAFKVITQYFLNEEKKDVEIITESFDGDKIIATLKVDGSIYESRIIGVKGGITLV